MRNPSRSQIKPNQKQAEIKPEAKSSRNPAEIQTRIKPKASQIEENPRKILNESQKPKSSQIKPKIQVEIKEIKPKSLRSRRKPKPAAGQAALTVHPLWGGPRGPSRGAPQQGGH